MQPRANGCSGVESHRNLSQSLTQIAANSPPSMPSVASFYVRMGRVLGHSPQARQLTGCKRPTSAQGMDRFSAAPCASNCRYLPGRPRYRPTPPIPMWIRSALGQRGCTRLMLTSIDSQR